MRRFWVLLLAAALMAVGSAAQEKAADEKKKEKEKATAAKQSEWTGIIIRHSDEQSTLTVSSMGFEKTVAFDNSTKWTIGGKPAERSEFSDGSKVSCWGTYDKKGRLVATQVARAR